MADSASKPGNFRRPRNHEAGRARAARHAEAVATGPLGVLSHDELGVIFDGLADPLQPIVAVALSSSCAGLWTPLRAANHQLRLQHERVGLLCRKVGMSCAELRDAVKLYWARKHLAAEDMAILGMLLPKRLPMLRELVLYQNGFGEAGMQNLCDGLGQSDASSLRILNLGKNNFGPAGAEVFAAALRRGALPNLETLILSDNPLGKQGAAVLAAPMRKLPLLTQLHFVSCELGDEGLASLLDNLGKEDFKALGTLDLVGNGLTDDGCATIVCALNNATMPMLTRLWVPNIFFPQQLNPLNEFSDEALKELARAAAARQVGIDPLNDWESSEDEDEDEDDTEDEDEL